MFRIKSIEIDGLWGERTARIDFYNDVNFLIGANGSGKTTVVNILAAALGARRVTLQRLPFNHARIVLDGNANGEAILDVQKEVAESRVRLRYCIQEPNSLEKTYLLPQPVRERLHPAEGRDRSETAVEHIQRLVNLRWLSVHRAPVQSKGEEQTFESTVDIKLAQLSGELVRYASMISNRNRNRLWQFLDTVLLSVIDQPSFSSVSGVVEDLDIETERQTLGQMFETIWLQPEQYEAKMGLFMETVERAIRKQRENQQLSDDEIGAVFSMSRLRMLEQQWRATKEDQQRIEKPVTDLTDSLNRLFKRKSVLLNVRNELIAQLPNNEFLDLQDLSSGEKQLVILLGEAVLQQGAISVYLADEPELSLHVEWQEQLVSILRALNMNAQLIFATHSPDIVSTYGDRVIDMEQALQ
jgi:energy-coupling factor transporter ATP-binding protein EcfA2